MMALFPKEHVFELRTVFNVSLQAITVKQWEPAFKMKIICHAYPGTREEKTVKWKYNIYREALQTLIL